MITSTLPVSTQAGNRARSMGFKLLVVCMLALFMMLPALYVGSIVDERSTRAIEVVKDVSAHVGGQQTFLGPTLAVPYFIPSQLSAAEKHGVYFVSPANAGATVKVTTTERRRSLFKVPVFQAEGVFDGEFDLSGVPGAAPTNAVLDWDRAEIVVGVSDTRGALADATLTSAGTTSLLVPSGISQTLTMGKEDNPSLRLTLIGANVSRIASPNARFKVTSSFRFSGAQRLAVLAYGKTTRLSLQGDWPSPGFDGGFLPVNRSVSSNGFTADWSVPFIARGVRAEGPGESVTGLESTALGVSFIEVADPYQSVNRSLKYAPLFVGLVFLSYFIFEVTTGKRVHPAQYVLVGIAQLIFYLLLLSFAERTGFDFGFLLAGSASVSLLACNAGWVFASRGHGARALGVFALLYTLIYFMLRLEDNALLVGALASFCAVAAAMYFTRDMNWYGSMPFGGPINVSPPAFAGPKTDVPE